MNFEELSRCTDDFNGAQCKAVCVESVSCNLAEVVSIIVVVVVAILVVLGIIVILVVLLL